MSNVKCRWKEYGIWNKRITKRLMHNPPAQHAAAGPLVGVVATTLWTVTATGSITILERTWAGIVAEHSRHESVN